ncbi:hypothetical protein QJS10_CPB13g01244 [Acorus calamus]|uniref:Uncharacterized protein n=1 Tax=Acorus calamus TaxID=4465 RepID=A0AAV9DIS5_ACOCL|nr:hypothetical protein QJS10_CPB13g01244 [Acorus calamus]
MEKERYQRFFRANETHKMEILRLITLNVQLTFHGKELKEVIAPAIQKIVDNWRVAIISLESVQFSITWRPLDLE